MKVPHLFPRIGLVVALLVGLTSCYLPIRFDGEITIDRRGYYSMIFDGYLVETRIYTALKDNKLTSAQEAEEVKKLKADIERDPSASDFSYVRKGYFKMHWKREGDLLQAKSVTFLRRNEYIFGLSYLKKTYTVGMQGRSLSKKQKDDIVKLGLNMTGQLRVITNGKVVGHNADSVKPAPVKGPDYSAYIWNINNIYAKTPSLTMSLR